MVNYIKLTVYQDLSEKMISIWKDIVKNLSQNKRVNVVTRRSKTCYYYKMILKKEISEFELKFIVNAWDYYYSQDFEIEANSSDYITFDDVEIDENTLEFIKNISSKYLHNRWVDKKINDGWRYGMYYNSDELTHPALRSWDNLPSELQNCVNIEPKKAYTFYINHTNLFH